MKNLNLSKYSNLESRVNEACAVMEQAQNEWEMNSGDKEKERVAIAARVKYLMLQNLLLCQLKQAAKL